VDDARIAGGLAVLKSRTIDARIERGEYIDNYETIRKRKDGSLVPISLMVSPITNGNGAITGAWKIARGISRRGKQERI
jgi:PAS domain S-box-containing protein